MTLEGDLRFFRLTDVLLRAGNQQRTGILTVQGEQDIIAVSFLHGQIVAADALNQSVEEGLGGVLGSQGLVDRETFLQVVADHQSGGERLTELLVARGLVNRRQLLEALRVQTYHLLLELLRWREGEFKFYAGNEVSYEEGFAPISIEELLVRAMRDIGGEAGLGEEVPQPFVVYRREPSPRPLKVLGRDGESEVEDPAAIWISADELRVFEALDGQALAGELAGRLALSEHQLLFALVRLMQLGLAAATEATSLAASEPRFFPVVEEVKPATRPQPALLPSVDEVRAPASPAPAGRRLAFLHAQGAGLAAVLLIGLAVLQPQALLLPFPWQAPERAVFEKQQRVAAHLRVDRAARTFFLLEGRYPEGLKQLVAMRLLAERDLRNAQGHLLDYQHTAADYSVQPIISGRARPDLGGSEGITGDFWLDPEFLLGEGRDEEIPVVLLD